MKAKSEKNEVKNILRFVYFDAGGVVIKDFSGTDNWVKLRRHIGIKSEKEKEFEAFFDMYEKEVCMGRDIETLVPIIRKKFLVDLPENYSLLKDFVNRFKKNESIWPVLEYAKKKYRIGLLTNMYTNMLDLIYKKGIMPKIEWDVVIDSSIEKVVKPQKEIFELAQKRAGVISKEILFVENSKKNVEAAMSFGWSTYHYDSSNTKKSSKELMNLIS